MTSMFGLLAILIADAGAGASSADAMRLETAESSRPTLPSHLADVEVIWNGTARHGRLIVTADGGIHLEHLDEEVRRWAHAAIRRASTPAQGWDDRTDPVRCVWRRLGPDVALAEVHTPTASVTITRHRRLPGR